MKKSKEMELEADLRNKLQTAVTALELIKERKTVPARMINSALKDLEKVLDLIAK